MTAPLVLLHGLSDSGDCWPGVVAHVRDRRVLTPTALGHGGRPLPDVFAVSALGADVVATLRSELGPGPGTDLGSALGTEAGTARGTEPGTGRAVMVGHSMGGLVAQEVALTAPDLVAAVVLVDPAWTGRDVPPDWLAGAVAARDTPVEALVAQSRRDDPTWPDDERAPWAAARAGLHPRLAAVPHRWAERDWPAAVGEITASGIPVTLVTGDPDRTIVGPPLVARALASVAEAGPDAARLTVVNLPGTGHSVHRDARAAFLRTLDTVLAST